MNAVLYFAPSHANDHEMRLHRIGFLEGAIEGIRLYAVWRNGEQLVGCLERPLAEVLAPFKEELERLQRIDKAANADKP